MKLGIMLGGIIMLSLSAVGCSHPPKRTMLHDFGLASPAATAINQPITQPVITVDAPTWLWDNRIRYRLLFSDPTQVRFYGLDLWIASPPELFEQRLLNSEPPIAYPLLIRLLDFEQQFDAADRARVVLRFSVEAYSVDHQRKRGSQLFSLALPTQSPDAAGAIEGFSVLARQATTKIQDWLSGLN